MGGLEMQPPELDFTNFLRDLGIDKLSPEGQAAFVEKIMRLVHDRVGMRVFDLLTEEQKQQVQATIERNGPDAGFDELERLYPNYRQLYQEELDQLHEEMVKVIFKDSP